MATTMEAATSSSVTSYGPQAKKQFQALFDVIPFNFTIEEDSIGAEDSSTADLTVPGAALGDFVLVSLLVDQVSVDVMAWVASADTVTIALQNLETSDANTTLATAAAGKGIVLKPNSNIWSAPAG